jgi:hypothetical protein
MNGFPQKKKKKKKKDWDGTEEVEGWIEGIRKETESVLGIENRKREINAVFCLLPFYKHQWKSVIHAAL